jgi:hypothetical protein
VCVCVRVFSKMTRKTACSSCNDKLRRCSCVDVLLFLYLRICVRNLSLNSLIGRFFPPADCAQLADDTLLDPRATLDCRTAAEHSVCVSQFEHCFTPSVPYPILRTEPVAGALRRHAHCNRPGTRSAVYWSSSDSIPGLCAPSPPHLLPEWNVGGGGWTQAIERHQSHCAFYCTGKN